jgi:hypothetical protein
MSERLQYLIDKEQVAGLDKGERYELIELLISEEGNDGGN